MNSDPHPMRELTDGGAGHVVEANGALLHYGARGHGPPLILIHGGLGSSSQWAPVVPALAARLSATPGVVDHGLFPPALVGGVLIARAGRVEAC